jgi:hypothetical protein
MKQNQLGTLARNQKQYNFLKVKNRETKLKSTIEIGAD